MEAIIPFHDELSPQNELFLLKRLSEVVSIGKCDEKRGELNQLPAPPPPPMPVPSLVFESVSAASKDKVWLVPLSSLPAAPPQPRLEPRRLSLPKSERRTASDSDTYLAVPAAAVVAAVAAVVLLLLLLAFACC